MASAGMQAGPREFRFRVITHTVVYVLGFWAPWNYLLRLDGSGPNPHLWGVLSADLSKAGVMSIGAAFDMVLVAGIVCAVVGACLRTWGAAYLGVQVVEAGQMRAEGVLADGPYRYVRNPLYLGTMVHTLALALLMPPSGAVFAIVAIAVVEVRLILGEEAYLTGKLGAPYAEYCALVPRIVPSLRARTQAGGVATQWKRAFLGETYFWGVAVSFAVLGWRYNSFLLFQCAVVSMGLSIVVRALAPADRGAAPRS